MPVQDVNGSQNKIVIKRKKPVVPVWVLRSVFVLLIIGIIVSSTACKGSLGRICTFGVEKFVAICPLGYLGMAFASKSPLWNLLPGVVVAVLLVLVFGRAFCAWVCPASIVQSLKSKVRLKIFRPQSAKPKALKSKLSQNGTAYSGLAVLAGALASSYLFGFPVFCLVCPVGLTFGTIFAAVRWFSGSPPGLELVVFPAIIIAELFMLKSWCRSLCPLGTLLGLISRLNFLLRPKLQQDECLGARGLNCRICEKACPQGMTREEIERGPSSAQCTKCFECHEKCPAGAIHIKAFRA